MSDISEEDDESEREPKSLKSEADEEEELDELPCSSVGEDAGTRKNQVMKNRYDVRNSRKVP